MCAYIMMERKKDPGDQEFDVMIDNFPKLNRSFPLFFNEEELKHLDGSARKEELKE